MFITGNVTDFMPQIKRGHTNSHNAAIFLVPEEGTLFKLIYTLHTIISFLEQEEWGLFLNNYVWGKEKDKYLNHAPMNLSLKLRRTTTVCFGARDQQQQRRMMTSVEAVI